MKAKDVSKKINSAMNEAKPQCKLKPGQGASSFTLMNAAATCLRDAGLDDQARKLIFAIMKTDQDFVNTRNLIKKYVDLVQSRRNKMDPLDIKYVANCKECGSPVLTISKVGADPELVFTCKCF